MFFLVTAFLKWRAFLAGTPSAVSEVAPQLEWGLIQFEFLLAVWLLSGLAAREVWWVLVITFSVLAGASVYQVWMGQSSCGCFGQFSLHPIWVVLLDTCLLLLLYWFGPTTQATTDASAANRIPENLIPSLIARGLIPFVTALGLGLGTVLMAMTPSLANLISANIAPTWSGQYLITKPVIANVGVGKPGEWLDVRLVVNNRSKEPIRLIGAANDCQCTAGQDLPVTIASGAETKIRVRVKIGDTEGFRDGKIWFRTDHAPQPLLLCRWRGFVKS